MAGEETWVDELTTVERFSSTSADDASYESGDFRDYLFERDHPTLVRLRTESLEEFAADRLDSPIMREVLARWEAAYAEPFVGVTAAGTVETNLYGDRVLLEGEQAPTAQMVAAAHSALATMTHEQQERYRYPLEAPEWRAWSNPEILIHDVGLRLDAVGESQKLAILGLVQASLSHEGYYLVRELMSLNGFLGELVDLPRALNEFSYQVALFGEPSLDQPWGWQLFGHHVALNVLVAGDRMVVSPVFLGAEPNRRDAGSEIMLGRRQQLALTLMSQLSDEQRNRAQLYPSVRSPQMPEGRIEPVQERHLAGAFQDNRVIPLEGICARDFDADQRGTLLELIADHIVLLPSGPRSARAREISAHLDETWFCWIGGTTERSPFYFRVQSPVFLAELDHHAGVWLTNQFPAIFHVHTTMRTPNGGDYGRALIGQHPNSSQKGAP